MKTMDKMVTKIALNIARKNDVLDTLLAEMMVKEGSEYIETLRKNKLITGEEMLEGAKCFAKVALETQRG